MIGWLPDSLKTYAHILSNFFTTVGFARFFPDLLKEHGINKRLDIRCGFNKKFLTGHLQEKHTSQVWFKPENTIEYAFNFGCGIFTGPAPDSNPISLFSNLMNANKKPAKNEDGEE